MSDSRNNAPYLYVATITLFCMSISTISNGLILPGLDVDLNLELLKKKNRECSVTNIACDCGSTGSRIYVTVPQCPYFHRWTTRCQPCENKTMDKICPTFQNCLECYSGGRDECRKCPPNTYGDWCDKDCSCQNMGECNRAGTCLCQTDFEGAYCEKMKTSCIDPGDLENGFVTAVGKINSTFYVGSSINYSCQSLHYLSGARTISCTENGTWHEELPVCVRIDTCETPPVPASGLMNYLPPFETKAAERFALRSSERGFRLTRVPAGLEAQLPSTSGLSSPKSTNKPEESNIPLPSGRHRAGTRAVYECESRYYRLVGSRTRRCQRQGEWSGRPPTCIPVCGRSNSPRSPFIVNGNATEIGQWPWQAGIARYLPDYNDWFLLCGGSLIAEQWVITAAHCITYSGTALSIDADKFRIYIGKYYRSDSKDDDYVQIKTVREINIHPDYDPGMFDADIALIHLDSPVQLSSRVQTVCLPSEQFADKDITPGKMGVVTGWGMNENESYSDTLQQAVLPVVSHEECEKGYADSDMPLTVTENMFCAGFKQGRMDACSGDSGGPMVFVDDSSKRRSWVLEGIVSWGSPNGCGQPDQYGGFTAVRKFLHWIHLYI